MTPFRWLVAGGCLYELASLHERSPLPTISTLIKYCTHDKRGRVLAWVWAGAWAYHFMVDEPAPTSPSG